MKNIHLIHVNRAKASLYHCSNTRDFFTTEQTSGDLLYELYITSDEEIKEGDWYYLPRTNSVHKCIEATELNLERRLGVAKIILTTDQDLIKDGLQAIDDEFLELFVKNPSCESVEVEKDVFFESVNYHFYKNIILKEKAKIILKEKAKQETVQEVAERLYPIKIESCMEGKIDVNSYERNLFIKGAKWQAERMYSEEDLKEVYKVNYTPFSANNFGDFDKDWNKWFEQFKKK